MAPRRKIPVAPPSSEPEAPSAPSSLATLVEEWQRIKAHLTTQAKAYAEYAAPYNERKAAIENQLHAFLNENKLDSSKTEFGTFHKIHSTTAKIVDRTVFLDWCLENWDAFGNELLQIGAPQITAFKAFMETRKKAIEEWAAVHDGELPVDASLYPPGTDASFFESIGVRKA